MTDYLDGVLPPDWRAAVEDHLTGCDGCTRYLQQIRATIDLLERIDADAQPPPADAGTAAGPPDRST